MDEPKPNPPAGAADGSRAEPPEMAARIVPMVRSCVVAHPVAGFTAALAAGMILGWLVKRR